ncbi:hypothetical protein E4U52_007994, partial [Claviceps spartinae]
MQDNFVGISSHDSSLEELYRGRLPHASQLNCEQQAVWHIFSRHCCEIHIINVQVDSYNRDQLKETDAPIIEIVCNSIGGGGNASSRDAGNLQQQLSLCVGAKRIPMLTEDIWTAKEFVNGAIGTVVDM